MASVTTVPVNHPHKSASASNGSAGLVKNVSKADEARVTVRSHTRAAPSPCTPKVHVEAVSVSTGPKAGDMNQSASAKRANIEGNESAKYEKLEKRSLTSLKGGGTEQELRDGHNTKNWIAGAIKHPGALHEQLGVPKGEKIPAKKMSAARSGKYGATAAKRANLAKTLGGFRKK